MKNQAQHIIPVGGEEPLHHAAWDCWCQPLHKDGLMMHNAKDTREAQERQGNADPDRQWVRIWGPILSSTDHIDRLQKACHVANKKQKAAEDLADELREANDRLRHQLRKSTDKLILLAQIVEEGES